jgi:hypothetical protein
LQPWFDTELLEQARSAGGRANYKPYFVRPKTARGAGAALAAETCGELEMQRKPMGDIDHVEGKKLVAIEWWLQAAD